MHVLLIGGSGFIGPHVVAALEALGHDVTVLHRGNAPLPNPNGRTRQVVGNRQQLAEHRDQLRALAPDVVVDLILSSGRQARELMDVFRGATERVVALSSCDVYRSCGVLHRLEPGPLEPVPLTETSALRSRLQTYPPESIAMLKQVFGWLDDEYDKIPAEREILGDTELPGTVLRLPMVFGPGDRLRRLLPLVKRFDDGRTTILLEEKLAEWRAPRGYVGNVAEAIALAAANPRAAGRVYNVGDHNFSELEWAQRVAAVAGWRGELVTLPKERMPAHLLMPGNTDQQWTTDTTRIRRELGFVEPVALDVAIRRTVEWERANPTSSSPPHVFDYAAEDAALAGAMT